MERHEEGKMMSIKWVITNKGTGEHPIAKARLVEREFNTGGKRGELFAGTPGLMAMRTVISRAMTKCEDGAKRSIMLPGSFSLDRVATPSRLRYFPPHRCHLRYQPGGEQGDVLGTIQSALALEQARDAHLGEFFSNLLEAQGVCDEWFVDDGQVFVRPFQFDHFLRALDASLASFGSTRESAAHGNVKSSARPALSSHGTRRSCTTSLTSSPRSRAPRRRGQLLDPASTSTHERGSQLACDEMRSAIGSVDHAPHRWFLPGGA